MYATACPHAVLRELLECITDPARGERYAVVLPPALAGTVDLFGWNHYVARFIDPARPAEGEPPAKRQCVRPAWFPTAKQARAKRDGIYLSMFVDTLDDVFADLIVEMEEVRQTRSCKYPVQLKNEMTIITLLRDAGYMATRGEENGPNVEYTVKWSPAGLSSKCS